jgi:hypothetical protein
MQEMLGKTKAYTVVILHRTFKSNEPSAAAVIREHGRRNFELRRDGKLLIICPIRDESNVSGIGVFSTSPEETRGIYDDDPGVKAGIFTFEVHQTRSFPGDTLPK